MSKREKVFTAARAASHRQLRVGEEVRHVLAECLMRGDLPSMPESVLANRSITITQVQVSPDLQNANVFIMPLGGEQKEEIIKELKQIAPYLRHYLSKKLTTRYVPVLKFILDDSFDQAQRIEELLRKTPSSDE